MVIAAERSEACEPVQTYQLLTGSKTDPVDQVTDADLREALRLAIANYDAAKQAHIRAAALVDNLWSRRLSARSEIDAANAALDEIKDAIVAGSSEVSGLGAARNRFEVAELVLSSLVQAEPDLKDSLETARQRLANSEMQLNRKVREVVSASAGVKRIVEDFRVAKFTFLEQYKLMRALSSASLLPPDAGNWMRVDFGDGVNSPLPEPWRRAVQALRSDANATLPD
jgi:chromosome segregation ATPase